MIKRKGFEDVLTSTGKWNICREFVTRSVVMWERFVYNIGGEKHLKHQLANCESRTDIKVLVEQYCGELF